MARSIHIRRSGRNVLEGLHEEPMDGEEGLDGTGSVL
jgi:hypothetical protein